MKDYFQISEQNIKIYDCEIPELQPISQESDEQLQRTEEWFRQKTGKFSGSEIKKLMSCGQSTARLSWDRPEKIIDFSETAKNYIFGKAMERKTGIFPRMADIFNFKYGKQAEPIIVAKFKQKMPQIKEFREMPFISVKGHEDYLGASPDGSMIGIVFNGEKEYGFEAKGAMNWETLGSRVRKPLDDKHVDFWQLQTEMLAMQVDSMYYCISHPVVNAIDFINASYEEAFEMINDIEILQVKASPIHQNVIIKRAKIGNNAIELFLKGMNFDEAIQKACTEFNLGLTPSLEEPEPRHPEPIQEAVVKKPRITEKDLPF